MAYDKKNNKNYSGGFNSQKNNYKKQIQLDNEIANAQLVEFEAMKEKSRNKREINKKYKNKNIEEDFWDY